MTRAESSQGNPLEYPGAYTEYKAYVTQDPALRPWYELIQQAGDLQEQHNTRGLIELEYRISFGFSQTVSDEPYKLLRLLPRIQWLQDPGVHRVTGHNFSLPVMEFGRSRIDLYKAIHNGKLSQGFAFPIPPESLDLPEGTHPVLVSCLPTETPELSFAIPHAQRRRHELMHAVDPNIVRRPGLEKVIQRELAATLGETTFDDRNNGAQVNIASGFWFSYLVNSPATRLHAAESAARLANYVREITAHGQPLLNDALVRGLMLTQEDLILRQLIAPPRRRGVAPIERIT